MKIICFDAEFANEAGNPEEILELSIWEADGIGVETPRRQVFHQYFRPVVHRRWPHSQPVHHITPAMVADKAHFGHWKARIQQIIDESDCIVGFAIDNDITALQREGIRNLERKSIVDVKDFHWLQNTRKTGMDLNSRKNLATTALDLGIEFSENLAHGADYDTRKTLECFQHLAETFVAAEKNEGRLTADNEFLAHYLKRWEEERENFLREYARGWIILTEWRDGYRLKASREKPQEKPEIKIVAEVGARYRAIDEIESRFDKKRASYDVNVFLLTEKDLRWIENYQNEYDGQEPLHNRMAKLRRQAARARM